MEQNRKAGQNPPRVVAPIEEEEDDGLLNMFRALICPSPGAQDYTCVITAYGV